MVKKIISVFLVCVSLFCCISITANAKVSVADVKNFRQSAATDTCVTLKWDNVGGAKGYRIYIYNSKNKAYESKCYSDSAGATISSLSPAASYRFRIKAYVSDSGKKVYSANYAYLTAVTAPSKVQNLKVSDKKKSSFLLSWDKVKGADGYLVQRLNPETDEWKTYKTTSSLSQKCYKEGKFRVLAYKLNGEAKIKSAASSSVSGSFKYVYSESGTFTFTVYGYGHGVGMSQTGAAYYAGKGWSYKKILTHYFSGTKVTLDEEMPKKITYGEKKYSVKQYLYRVTQAEIGNTAPIEAIKAQVVACYSYAKYKGFKLASYEHAFSDKDRVTDEVKKAVDAVTGMFVSYDGKACLTPYFSIAAGKTASCESTWGGKMPYLVAVDSSCDKKNPYWKTTYTISSEEFKERFLTDYGVELKGDPSKWIKIVSKDKAVSSSIGYVNKVSVGSMSFGGEKFRTSVMHYSLRSHCFTVSYKAD